MNEPLFTMGQTDNEDFAATASTATRPVNFANQDFNPGKVASQQSPHKQRSPCREQSGRPSTPFPENDVQFVPTYNNMAADQPSGGLVHNDPGNVNSTFSASGAMGAASPLNQANLHFSGNSGDALHHHHLEQQPGPLFFSQQQSWPPESHKLYYTQSLDLENSGMHRTNPFASGQRSASCDASQGSTTPTSPVEERIPNSAVRRSRVWKYGRRSSGNHSDRQPFTFSVSSSQAGGAITGIDQSSSRFFGKRSFSNTGTRNDESWSAEPTTKQFISEERMTAEMHNLSLDGVHRQPMVPLPSSSTSSSSSSLPASPNMSSAPNLNLPSTSGQCNHGNSSNLLRHHQCHHHHHPRSRSYAEVVLANIERRLDDDSDDEGVEEDMPPNQGDGHRLQMTPQLVSALKATKGTSGHMLPQDIVKKIVASPCMELVLWRPLSFINPRLGPDSSSSPSSPSSSGSELAPIMEVEVERERAEASSMVRQPQPYDGMPGGEGMQDEALPDFDEDMDL